MNNKIIIPSFILILLTLFSCQKTIPLLGELDHKKDVKFYFLSSEIMGPNTTRELSDFQKEFGSFYIEDEKMIQVLKEQWAFAPVEQFDNFIADYYLTYTEDGIYRGKISIDIKNNLAVSGYGPTTFDKESLYDLKDVAKKLNPIFVQFEELDQARTFYQNVDKSYLLASDNDTEFYKWVEFDGESILKVNNKQFARDIDINKAFKEYMPKRFAEEKHYYNIFRFTPENSTIRLCSNKDLSEKFPEDFYVKIPWKRYNTIILPLINISHEQFDAIIAKHQISKFKIIDKIE